MCPPDCDDPWIKHLSAFYPPKKLHALGAVTFLWNACENSMADIFVEVSGIPHRTAWILTKEMGVVTLCAKIVEVARAKPLAAAVIEYLDHELKVFDLCRRNRNQLTHFQIGFEAEPNGALQMAIKRRSKTQPDPVSIPEDLKDIRRVADEIGDLRQNLTDFFMFLTSQGEATPWPLPGKLPLPALLESPLPANQPAPRSRRRSSPA